MSTVTVLDGGFSSQLKRYVEPFDGDPLWTARFLKEKPMECSYVHRDYVLAGANVVSTGTYQVSIEGYKKYLGVSEEEVIQLIKNSVNLARDGIKMAEKESGKDYSGVRIAGSVGPYGASLHDGSEYTGSYCSQVTEDELITWHRPRVTALLEAGVDILALETLPCLKEALALIRLLKELPEATAWISFSIKDKDSISSGEKFSECAAKCWEQSSQLIAIGANCFCPSLVSPLFKQLAKQSPQIKLITYPNKGFIYDRSTRKYVADSQGIKIEDCIEEWLDIGIKYIGGCCTNDSENIKNILNKVQQWEKKIKN